VPAPALADDDAIEQAQGGIQRRRPVAHIVVRLAFRHVRSQRQHRTRAMDAIYGPHNFKNEISWKRTTTKSDYRQGAKNRPRVRDVMLYYAKDARLLQTFNQPFSTYSEDYIQSKYRHVDADGRRYMLDKLTAPGSGTRGHPKCEFMGVTRHWVYNHETMKEMVTVGRIVTAESGFCATVQTVSR
jgi:hypothetical protein